MKDMDTAQVDVSVQFRSHSPSFCTLRDVGFESALHRAYHRYMTQFCAKSEGRLRWVFTATMRDVPGTVNELTRCAEQNANLVGVVDSPSCPDGSLMDNPALHSLYERAQDLDLPLMVHGGMLRPPSEVVAEARLFHTVESDEQYLSHCVVALGENMWVFATDYPHIGSPWPEGVPNIANRPELFESVKVKLLSQNALRMCPRSAL